MRFALVTLLAVTACYDDHYTCTTNAQCDLGDGGRCELDGHCTVFDGNCATERRYAEHSGPRSGVCYEYQVAPLDPCAGGQSPAPREGCYASVCQALPACCDIGWSDACVQLAQQLCTLRCDTRIAVTAIRSNIVRELWDLRWTGSQFMVPGNAPASNFVDLIAWVAPAPGGHEPRLAGVADGGTLLVIGEHTRSITPDRNYQSITSVDVDRDGRDTLVMTYERGGPIAEIVEPDTGVVREVPVTTSSRLTWGDLDRDRYPDAVAATGPRYEFFENRADETYARTLVNQQFSTVTGGPTQGGVQVRDLDWIDLDGDHLLDLAAFGSSVRIHTTAAGLRDAAELDLDCDPPDPDRGCAPQPEPDFERVTFGGAALPSATDPQILITTFPHRRLYRGYFNGSTFRVERIAFPGDGCTCDETCAMGMCTYDCLGSMPPCPTINAVVVRDLDGDNLLDIVAIDMKLRVYHALAKDDHAFRAPPYQIPTMLPAFATIDVSVSGAVLP